MSTTKPTAPKKPALETLDIPADAAAEILAKHRPDKLICVSIGPYNFVMRAPDGPAWTAYKVRNRSGNAVEVARSAELMVHELLLFPSVDELTAIGAEYPGIPDALGGTIVEKSCGGFELQEKKLPSSSS